MFVLAVSAVAIVWIWAATGEEDAISISTGRRRSATEKGHLVSRCRCLLLVLFLLAVIFIFVVKVLVVVVALAVSTTSSSEASAVGCGMVDQEGLPVAVVVSSNVYG